MLKLVLLGPPGAGKGTHAKILSEKLQSPHLATGDILRQQIKNKTSLGIQAKDIIERGELVPDDLVNRMMESEIEKLPSTTGFILDGFPRTLGQAQALESFLKKINRPLDAVLNFATSEKIIIDRLSGRRVCPGCGKGYHIRNIPSKKEGICDACNTELQQRKDDKPETIKNRLEVYSRETEPLIGFYRKKGILLDVTGDFDIPELQAELKGLFEKFNVSL